MSSSLSRLEARWLYVNDAHCSSTNLLQHSFAEKSSAAADYFAIVAQ